MSDRRSNEVPDKSEREAALGEPFARDARPLPIAHLGYELEGLKAPQWITEAEFRRLIEHAVDEYHSMPHPRPTDANVGTSPVHAKAACERLHMFLREALVPFGQPGDDA